MDEKQVKINRNLELATTVQLVKEAIAFEADIFLINHGKRGNAKKAYEIDTLGIVSGDTITIIADGPQAQQAVNHLYTFINQL